MFVIYDRDDVEFDEFGETGTCSELFKKSFLSFDDDVKDSLFNSVLYRMLFKPTENDRVSRKNIESTLGKEFFDEISESKELLQLDDSIEGFFKKCVLVNDFLEKKDLFLRVYERRDKFRYLIKEGVHGKNKVIRGLSSCVVKKFNGYEIMKKSLQHKEKKHFEPVDIVYESVIKCFFTDNLHLAFRSYIDKKQKGYYRLLHPPARQCYYCDNYFTCSKNEFSKHVKIARA